MFGSSSLSDSIVSDRGSLFISEFWKAVCHRLRVSIDLSTAYHPESDGQTEIANALPERFTFSLLHRLLSARLGRMAPSCRIRRQ